MIGIVADHGGYELKEFLRNTMNEKWKDYGCFSGDSVDYPDMAKALACGIKNGEVTRGIAICGTGIGISIALNRFSGVRAALCYDHFTAEMARRHNHANILCLGGRNIKKEVAVELVKIFLQTPFDGERHERRIQKIEENIQNC